MQFEGALLREQGVEFAIVIVKKGVLDNGSTAHDAIEGFSPVFPGLPIVLMAQDSRGTPYYRGRSDIVRFLSHVHPGRIPWQRFSFG